VKQRDHSAPSSALALPVKAGAALAASGALAATTRRRRRPSPD
jgi:hypothetical protein